MLLYQLTNLLNPAKESRLVATDLFENCCGTPYKHPAVPVIAPGLEILRRFGRIRLLDESSHWMPFQLALFCQDGLPVRLDIAVPCFRTNRLNAQGDQKTLCRKVRGKGHGRIEVALTFHNMVSRHNHHNGIRIPTEQF